ncbi:MAG: RusA family crossover junction endodeoxyribonuclease [Patescibacteria group bacterium]
MAKEIRFKIEGLVPSKKNKVRHRFGGGGFYDPETRREIDWLVMQLRSKAPKETFKCEMEVHTEIHTNRRQDGDNAHTTILDCLQSAGIIKNDKDIIRGSWERKTVKTIEECKVWITICLL